MKTPLSLLCITILLSACARISVSSEDAKNPLVLSRYGEELADTMADLVIQADPLLKDEPMKARVNDAIAKGKEIASEARLLEKEGFMGTLIPVKGDSVGTVLYLHDTVFASTDFYETPGVNVRVYLTTVVDPREGTFPDDTAVDLGPLPTTFGAFSLDVPKLQEPELLRTVVIWDAALKRMHGFAQLSR